MFKLWQNIKKYYRLFELIILVFFLFLILFISSLQIVLRNFFQAVEWFDLLLKYSVLWAGMFAASIATYEHKHIKIDLISRFTKGRFKSAIVAIADLFASIICGILLYSFVIYIVKIEYPSTDPAPFLGIKKWVMLLVLPFNFFIMSFRFLVRFFTNVYNFMNNKEEIENDDFIDSMKKNEGEIK